MEFEVVPVRGMIENAYLITGPRVALVDTLAPTSWRRLLAALSAARLSIGDIEYILLTHCHVDHVGNAARLKELSGAEVIAGGPDAAVIEGSEPNPPVSDLSRAARLMKKLPDSLIDAYQRCRPAVVDRLVSDGDRIEELGMEVVAVPGHTEGGVAYHDPGDHGAFIGDLVSYYFRRPGMPVLSASLSVERILDSQDRLAGLGLRTAYPGHGAVIGPGASVIIGGFAERKRRDFGL